MEVWLDVLETIREPVLRNEDRIEYKVGCHLNDRLCSLNLMTGSKT